jgi:hypothetical protein
MLIAVLVNFFPTNILSINLQDKLAYDLNFKTNGTKETGRETCCKTLSQSCKKGCNKGRSKKEVNDYGFIG